MVRQQFTRKIQVAFTFFIILCVAAVFYWGYYLPMRQDSAYDAALVGGMNTLAEKVGKLLDTDSLPLFNDLNQPVAISAQNAETVTQAASQFAGYLDDLEKVVRGNDQQYLYGFSKSAAQTRAHKLRAQAAISQSRQVIAAYAAETTYLQSLSQIANEYTTITARLIGTADLNNYVNRSDELRADSDSIQKLADRLLAVATPPELVSLRDQVTAQYKETAAGYNDLAYGIDTAVDDTIYAAAQRIEASIHTLDTDVQNQYTVTMASSNVMKQFGELPDKYIVE